MIIGIVGNGADKFTPEGEALAKKYIHALLTDKIIEANLFHSHILTVRSGHSIMGGIDIWAEEIARSMGIGLDIKAPKTESWGGDYGYKARNLDIADSDEVEVIVADTYPSNYTGKRFKECYHCHTSDHVKSGACWTGKQAQKKGNKATWIVVRNDGSGAHEIPVPVYKTLAPDEEKELFKKVEDSLKASLERANKLRQITL